MFFVFGGCGRKGETGTYLRGGEGDNCPSFNVEVQNVPITCFVGRLTEQAPKEVLDQYRYFTNQIELWSARISEDPSDDSARKLRERFAQEKQFSDASRSYWDYGMLRHSLISKGGKTLYVATYLDAVTTNEVWCVFWGNESLLNADFGAELARSSKLHLKSNLGKLDNKSPLRTTNGAIIPRNLFAFFEDAQ